MTAVNEELVLTVWLCTVPRYVPETVTVGFDGAGSSETTVNPGGGAGIESFCLSLQGLPSMDETFSR